MQEDSILKSLLKLLGGLILFIVALGGLGYWQNKDAQVSFAAIQNESRGFAELKNRFSPQSIGATCKVFGPVRPFDCLGRTIAKIDVRRLSSTGLTLLANVGIYVTTNERHDAVAKRNLDQDLTYELDLLQLDQFVLESFVNRGKPSPYTLRLIDHVDRHIQTRYLDSSGKRLSAFWVKVNAKAAKIQRMDATTRARYEKLKKKYEVLRPQIEDGARFSWVDRLSGWALNVLNNYNQRH